MKTGAVDFLTKPFAGNDLLGAIERAVTKDARDLAAEARTAEIQARVRALTPRDVQGRGSAERLRQVSGGVAGGIAGVKSVKNEMRVK